MIPVALWRGTGGPARRGPRIASAKIARRSAASWSLAADSMSSPPPQDPGRGCRAPPDASQKQQFLRAVFLTRRYYTRAAAKLSLKLSAGRTLLVQLGVNAERILVESRSRNTAENARLSFAMVDLHPDEIWLLVTSAAHTRAVGAFRAAGFEVEAYPVDFRGVNSGLFFDLPGGLENTRFAVREYVGLLAYRLMGRTKDLFPRPQHHGRDTQR